MLYHRNIADRVTTIAHFLRYDDDPYMVVSDGPAVLDPRRLYESPINIPIQRRLPSGVNYIRNSVKVVVDAYNGTTDYYLADPPTRWRRRWPRSSRAF